METPPNAAGAKDFQVTGVSRSGRVRKKSSKLLDFQSPDEVDKKPKRTPRAAPRSTRGRPPLIDSAWKRKSVEGTSSAVDDVAVDDDEPQEDGDLAIANSIKADANVANTARITDDDDDEDELDELVADIVEGVEAEADANESRVRQSLYMTEKSNKKKILKDGRVVTGKIQRKDKGKTRFTAYSLWAREFRKSSKFGSNQDMDFATTARRLSELWANVPNNEKNVWRRKAKRLAIRNPKQETPAPASTPTSTASNSFLNRATTTRTKKLAAEKLKSPQETKKTNKSPASTTPSKRGRKELSDKNSPTNKTSIHTSTQNHTKTITNNSHNSHHNMNSSSSSNALSHIKLPKSGIEPIDAAAHLKLLGESLTIIGERLKEHEGQITVSGSLSVLLDSLLCSVGPLLCLTTRIPGLEKRKELSDNLSATLDNIAYVMPGL